MGVSKRLTELRYLYILFMVTPKTIECDWCVDALSFYSLASLD